MIQRHLAILMIIQLTLLLIALHKAPANAVNLHNTITCSREVAQGGWASTIRKIPNTAHTTTQSALTFFSIEMLAASCKGCNCARHSIIELLKPSRAGADRTLARLACCSKTCEESMRMCHTTVPQTKPHTTYMNRAHSSRAKGILVIRLAL